jgi:ornithine cyclodeaminase/alanine dehydrogenase-like protein (mu-crystallin family)
MRALILGHREVLAALPLEACAQAMAAVLTERKGDRELALFRSLGLAVEDLAAAELAVAVATERGIGTEVEL